jgi:hypothetical protein
MQRQTTWQTFGADEYFVPHLAKSQKLMAKSHSFWHNFSFSYVIKHIMNTILRFLVLFALIGACSPNQYGKKVNEPFQGNAYESNNRFFRGTGKGESSADNIARGKADIDAKAQLAGQVNTTMKQVADQYLGQTENENGADVADKFQSLVREVMNTDIADLRKIGEKKYYDAKSNKYTVFIAYEIKKNAMLRFMKKQAKTDQRIDERQRAVIEKIIDEELEKADAEADN